MKITTCALIFISTMCFARPVKASGNPLVTSEIIRNWEPFFVEQVPNITVAAGKDATLHCQVDNLHGYKVGWIKSSDQTILTLHKKVITHNSRIKVTHDEQRTWSLIIKQVAEKDQGCYMCQINTAVMKKQIGCVTVHVAPDILAEATSSDTIVKEGEDVLLTCKATGRPEPQIMWRKEDGQSFVIKEGKAKRKVFMYRGENLQLHKVRRRDMGAFMCIASNNVPPTVSRRVSLNVNFPPSVTVGNQLVGCPVGEQVSLKCFVEASPKAISYWTRKSNEREYKDELLLEGLNFNITTEEKASYQTVLTLTIRKFSNKDVGTYTCISTNSLGRKEGTIRLYKIQQADTSPSGTDSIISTTPKEKGKSAENPLKQDILKTDYDLTTRGTFFKSSKKDGRRHSNTFSTDRPNSSSMAGAAAKFTFHRGFSHEDTWLILHKILIILMAQYSLH